jgi:glycosyltransferase involved in cell wall biosynthesis
MKCNTRIRFTPRSQIIVMELPQPAMSQPAPLISVVVPAYNAAGTIKATLCSVLGQTVDDLELIVIDDGSTDTTPDIARAIDDARVRVLRQRNAGHAGARNAGIAAARGRYVAVVDADDVWLPHKLQRQLTLLESGPGIRALHGSAVFVDDSLEPLFVAPSPDGKNELLDVLCFRGLAAMMATLIIERTLVAQVGAFDPSLIILQDWELAIRLARLGELYSTSEPLALYRLHSANQSRQLDLHIEPGERVLARFFAEPTLPPEVAGRRSYVYAHFYAMLSGGAFQLHEPAYAAYWARRALACDPRVLSYIASLPVRRLRRRLSRPRAAQIVDQRLRNA